MRHASQRRLGREHILALSGEPRNLPDDIVMFGLVLGAALAGALGGGSRVERRGDAHDDVGREQLRAVVCLDGDAVFDLCRAEFAHNRVDFEGEVDVFRGAVAHQLELAVGGYEGDDAVCVETAQFHALVELAIFQCHGSRRGARGSHRSVPVADGGAAARAAVEEEAVV